MFRQVLILVGVLLAVFLLSFIVLTLFGDNWENYCQQHHISKWVFPLYLLIDGNTFTSFYNDGSVSRKAIFIAFWIYVFGIIVFTGMIISVMTNMIERRVEDHLQGRLYYLKKGHYIIMGYDDIVPSFINHIFGKDAEAYVLILTSAKTGDVREKLRKSFNKTQMKHIILNYGHRISSENYKDIHLEFAEQIYVVGNRIKSAHDAINVECVDTICRYLGQDFVKSMPKRITCVFKDLDTYTAFKTSELFSKVSDLGMEFVPYNFYAGWAKQVFIKRKYRDMENPENEYDYPAVYGNGITPDDTKYVHLVFVGTTNFSVAFAMEAAHVLHFPNFKKKGDPKTRITFIDVNADKEKDEFIVRNRHFFEVQSYRYRDLSSPSVPNDEWQDVEPSFFTGDDSDFLDVQFEFIKGNMFSKRVQDEIRCWAEDKEGQYLSIFLATIDQRQNFVMGMNMPDEVYVNEIPVYIRQDRSDNFVTNLRTVDAEKKFSYYCIESGELNQTYRLARYAHIYPFGMNETGYSEDDHSLKRAKLVNYLYATANYDSNKFQGFLALNAMSDDTIWEEADAKWKELDVSLKWSNLYSAYTIRTKLASLRAMRNLNIDDTSKDTVTFSDTEVDEMARVEHNRWNVEKLLMGYRKARKEEDKYVHGSPLGQNKKLFIHHDIRPFDDLDNIQELDKEFSRYIPWIMKMTERK